MSTNTGPSQVLVIRHGEKLGNPRKEDDGGRHLSIQGSARAAALPSLFAPAMPQLSCQLHHSATEFHGLYVQIPLQGKAARFPAPNFIFATQRSKNSNRPIETVTPLANALNLHINDGYKDNDEKIKRMTNAILNDLTFAGKIVLICWHHGTIPAVAKALGVAKPPKWDAKVFDRVWQITYTKGKASLQDLPQMLLYGDSET
jgi:hypothetical protein